MEVGAPNSIDGCCRLPTRFRTGSAIPSTITFVSQPRISACVDMPINGAYLMLCTVFEERKAALMGRLGTKFCLETERMCSTDAVLACGRHAHVSI